jgi:quercetin dioxygenase-like cupin family protein
MPRVELIPEFLKGLPEIDLPIAGARGWLLQGDEQQVTFVEFDETIDVPEHQHAEQWELAIAGKVEMRLGGKTTIYTAGDSFVVPAGVPHGATVHAGYRALMVFNAPDRYRAKR